MEAHAAQAPVAPPRARQFRLPGVGAGLGRGYVVLWLSLIVLLPIAALADQAFSEGLGHFWSQVTSPAAKSSLELILVCSLIVVAINGVFGTIVAWLLVRDNFPGKAVVNAIIDLPFALPTIVASLILIELWGNKSPVGIDIALSRTAIVVALCFVTLPFVVRAVQPQYGAAQFSYNWNCCGFSAEYRKYELGSVRNENAYRFNFTLANIGTAGNLRRTERLF